MTPCPLSDLLTRAVEWLPPEASLGSAARRMADAGISSVVVVRDGRAVGILTESDVLQAMRAHRRPDVPVAHVMSAKVVVASPDMEFRDAYHLAARHHVKHLVVAGADGALVGVVTETDFRRHLGVDYFQNLQNVGSLMDRRCPRLPPDAPLESALRAMETGAGACVVVDPAGRPLGILTERDVVRLFAEFAGRDDLPERVDAVMSAPVLSVRLDGGVLDVARRMQEDSIRHLVVVDDQGAMAGIIGQHHMITPLAIEFLEEAMRTEVRLEEERDAAEERLRLIYESMEDGLWDMDLVTGKVYWNPRLYAMLGYQPDEFPVDIDVWRGLIHPEDVDSTLERFRVSLAPGAPPYRAEYRLRCKDGSWLWVEARGKVLARDGQDRATRRGGVTVDISRRRRAQETLLLMQRGVDQAPVSVVVTAPQGAIIYVNPYFCQVTGYAREEVLGRNPRMLKSGDAPRVQYEELWRTITAGQTWSGLLHNRHKDGSLFWEKAVISPLRDGLGHITAFVGVKENITEQKRLEDALKTREHYLRALVDNFPYLVWLKDKEGRFLIANRALADAAQAGSPDAMVGRMDRDFFPPAHAERYLADDERVMASGLPVTLEQTVVIAGRPVLHETYKSPLVDAGRLLGTVGFARDVSEEKRLEEAIRENRRLLANVLAAATEVSVIATDLDGRITLFNSGAERLLGYGAAEVVGVSTPDLFHDPGEIRRLFESVRGPANRQPAAPEWIPALIEAGEGRKIEWTYVTKRGERIPVLLTATRMRDGGETAHGYLGVAIDIRERKRLEQREHLRARALERVAGGDRLAETLAGIIDEIRSVSSAWIPAVLLLDKSGRHVTTCIAPGLREDLRKAFEGMAVADGHGSCATAIVRAERVVVEDVAQDALWQEFRDWAREAGITSCWSQPIVDSDGRVLGSFAAYHRTPAAPGPNDIRVLEEVARLAGLAIEKDRSAEGLRLAASVFEHAQEGIVITDSAGTIVDVNRSFTQITGYPREEVLGRNPSLLKSGHQDADFYAGMWTSLVRDGQWRGEVWNRRKDGQVFAEFLTISAVRPAPEAPASHYVGIFSDITLIKEHQSRLERMAHYDALTQLPNRTLLADRLQLALAHAARAGKQLAVCYLDLDGFKPVNDGFGHEAGDHLLVEVAGRLKACLRGSDTVARLGGDEFVILLGELEGFAECARALDRILHHVAEPYQINGTPVFISASAGVTLFPEDGGDADALLRHADQAMYLAKQAGRNRYHLFDPEHDRRARAHREAVGRIAQALADREFRLHYQPKVDMRRGQVFGVEALIRWQHPDRGLLSPAEFLPVVEDSELGSAIGDWVLGEALDQLDRWRREGVDLAVSVNISGHHLQRDDFVERLQSLLAAHGDLPPQRLELEVLETAALEDIAHVSSVIHRCNELGIGVALDDFGTGYSSLTYFRRLPARILKIDQSFVRDMLDDPDDLSIVEGVIGLTRAFQRQVIAEGVETPAHGALLLHLGCDLGQGYGIARPMAPERIPAWLCAFAPDPLWATALGFNWTREDLPLLSMEVEHRRWVDQLLAHVLRGEEGPPALDEHACRFGHWYDGPGAEHYGSLPSFTALAPLHRDLHAQGARLLALHGTRPELEIRDAADALVLARDRLLDHLRELLAAALLSSAGR